MSNKYDLSVAYRVYPKISKIPIVYPDDKYKLTELGLKSMKNAMEGLKVKLWVILDTCPAEYKKLINDVLSSSADIVFIELNKAGNAGSFRKQLEILTTQDDSDLVYLAEDDYFYLPGAFKEITDFIKSDNNIDFVSAYDHNDYYTNKLHDLKTRVRFFGNRHWRLSVSTCLTFLTRKAILKKYMDVFDTFARGNFDASLWISLTKFRIFNFPFQIKFLVKSRIFLKIFLKAWYYCLSQIIWGKRATLYTPLPSLCTHLDNIGVAPGIDWAAKFKEL